MYSEALALVCIGWFIFIAIVCAIGYIQLFIHYRSIPRRAAILSKNRNAIPHVTAIRPCKGLEPYLYECLAATFQQEYPRTKLTVHFCVSSKRDPAYPIIQQALKDHPDHDAKLFIEEDDPAIQAGKLGPNPKIRNMSRAYREAKRDIIWIIDCNVWVNPGACARMVDKLCGHTHHPQKRERPYKLVHLLPVSVDVPSNTLPDVPFQPNGALYDAPPPLSLNKPLPAQASTSNFGGRLETLFLSSSHAKMYIAINTVAIAPCIVGKATMFRRSHLSSLTRGQGIDYFSQNICEDHLVGDLLWKADFWSHTHNTSNGKGEWLRFKNHGLVLGDLAIQPVAGMSVSNYIARRVRWLRVRKFTVPTATLVEPGTESILCSAMGAWGVTTSHYTREFALSSTERLLGLEGQYWAVLAWFIGSLLIWSAIDYTTYLMLHSGATIETNTSHTSPSHTSPSHTTTTSIPAFILPPPTTRSKSPWLRSRRNWTSWALAWAGREILALPIWLYAIWGGVSVTWRDQRFWVGWDMTVHEILEDDKADQKTTVVDDGHEVYVKTSGAQAVERAMNGHATTATTASTGSDDHPGAMRSRRRRETASR